MSNSRPVRLFRNGRNQAVRIPREFELPGKEAVMRKEGEKLIIEPPPTPIKSLLELLASWEPLDGDFPEPPDLPPDPPPFLEEEQEPWTAKSRKGQPKMPKRTNKPAKPPRR
jgi:antitoxin VapB